MRRIILAEKLLSLFTSADRAAAIAGDLSEEQQDRRPFTFWLQVIRTTAALWSARVTEAPLRMIELVIRACVSFAGPAFLGVASVFLFPHQVHSPTGWVPLAFCWWGGALWTGISLVRNAPRDGMAAVMTLAFTVEIVLAAALVKTLWLESSSVQLFSFYAAGLAVAPIVVGGAIAQRRVIVKGSITMET